MTKCLIEKDRTACEGLFFHAAFLHDSNITRLLESESKTTNDEAVYCTYTRIVYLNEGRSKSSENDFKSCKAE